MKKEINFVLKKHWKWNLNEVGMALVMKQGIGMCM